jgi:hypothetical protein
MSGLQSCLRNFNGNQGQNRLLARGVRLCPSGDKCLTLINGISFPPTYSVVLALPTNGRMIIQIRPAQIPTAR